MKVRLLVFVPRGATLRGEDAHEDAQGAAKEVRDPGMAAIGTDENNGQKSGQKPVRPRTMATWPQWWERASRVLLVVMFSSTAPSRSMRAEAENRLMTAWMRRL
ncbi:hypothetical protein M3A49_15015 [Paraburkholderia sp. CNPSo 3076]|uniref:hypothetical protein n=1 Tax=Paraburkholderia sp. CNPSo 3076 TaxID=2940936 RepID=UPI002253F28B|nr:hypothetical protein [Paraburkholderia sp. CNPSo 3076]MCX5540791.1 hypothetical protein [Paraburkholderia sp. CNPSo 3076]